MDWIVVCNLNKFDINQHFQIHNYIVWKQPKGVKLGSLIYIYVSSPISAIMYECEVVEINISDQTLILDYYKDDSGNGATNIKDTDLYMKMKCTFKFSADQLGFEKMRHKGLNCVQRTTKLKQITKDYIISLKYKEG